MLRLDHLVVSCMDLAQARPLLEEKLGVPLFGHGIHAAMGTHNHLLSLGPEEYLELIAINPEGVAPAFPRWFNLDQFSGPPRLSNWVCATDDLDATLALAPEGAGQPMSLSRADLRWRFGVPPSGQLPFDDRFPALIEWEGKAHPAPNLPDHGLRLISLQLSHPKAAQLRDILLPLYDDHRLQIISGASGIRARIATPKGEVIL